jgi:hypothetical protein
MKSLQLEVRSLHSKLNTLRNDIVTIFQHLKVCPSVPNLEEGAKVDEFVAVLKSLVVKQQQNQQT